MSLITLLLEKGRACYGMSCTSRSLTPAAIEDNDGGLGVIAKHLSGEDQKTTSDGRQDVQKRTRVNLQSRSTPRMQRAQNCIRGCSARHSKNGAEWYHSDSQRATIYRATTNCKNGESRESKEVAN